jgi:DNA-binding MarR family transcriptional regulator
MKLETAIKQHYFRNEFQKVYLNLIYTANILQNRSEKFLKGYGITHAQYNVLRILRGQGTKAISTAEIRTRMLEKSSDASRIVDRLATRSLVTKRICSSDKRLVDVGISVRGLQLLELIEKDIEQLDRITAALSASEAKTLNGLLDKLRS